MLHCDQGLFTESAEMAEDFAVRLKALMRQKRVTLKQAADATGKSISAVQKWTTGGDITYDALRKLADFLEVNWIWLRYGEEALGNIESEVENDSVISRFRRKFIADIQEREALLMLALNSARLAVWQNNLVTGEFHTINDEEIFGTKIAYFDDILRIMLPEDHLCRNSAFEEALLSNKLYECDYRVRRPDTGQIRWIRVRGRIIHDPAGRPVRMTGVSFDVTDLKQAELAREETQRRLDDAMNAAEIGAWEWNIRTGEIWHSGNKGQILGIDSLRINSVEEFIQYIHPEDRDRVAQAVNDAVTQDRPYIERFRVVADDGKVIEIEDRGSVIRNQEGQPERMVGISRRIK